MILVQRSMEYTDYACTKRTLYRCLRHHGRTVWHFNTKRAGHKSMLHGSLATSVRKVNSVNSEGCRPWSLWENSVLHRLPEITDIINSGQMQRCSSHASATATCKQERPKQEGQDQASDAQKWLPALFSRKAYRASAMTLPSSSLRPALASCTAVTI